MLIFSGRAAAPRTAGKWAQKEAAATAMPGPGDCFCSRERKETTILRRCFAEAKDKHDLWWQRVTFRPYTKMHRLPAEPWCQHWRCKPVRSLGWLSLCGVKSKRSLLTCRKLGQPRSEAFRFESETSCRQSWSLRHRGEGILKSTKTKKTACDTWIQYFARWFLENSLDKTTCSLCPLPPFW